MNSLVRSLASTSALAAFVVVASSCTPIGNIEDRPLASSPGAAGGGETPTGVAGGGSSPAAGAGGAGAAGSSGSAGAGSGTAGGAG
ncbi:MAG TPA: hypothetical protein VHK47_19880, partial [Polyangia bacterium]|nr:hypothetical protein [Polyangia bacterium]